MSAGEDMGWDYALVSTVKSIAATQAIVCPSKGVIIKAAREKLGE